MEDYFTWEIFLEALNILKFKHNNLINCLSMEQQWEIRCATLECHKCI